MLARSMKYNKAELFDSLVCSLVATVATLLILGDREDIHFATITNAIALSRSDTTQIHVACARIR